MAGHLHVVWEEDSTFGNSGSDIDIFYKCRNATTGNWTVTEVVSKESTVNSNKQEIDTDPEGNAHIVWVEIVGPGAGINYKYRNATK